MITKLYVWSRTARIVRAAALAAALSVTTLAQAPTYYVRDLPGLGGTQTSPAMINDAGQVVGQSQTPAGQPHAFLWDAAAGIQDLGTIGGGTESYATAINPDGVVMGYGRQANGVYHAFVWDAATGIHDLGPAPEWNSFPAGINSDGEIAGQASFPPSGYQHPVKWDASRTMVDLGLFPNGRYGYASAINDAGQVVGGAEWSQTTGEFRAFVWDETGGLQPLATLGGTWAYAASINNAGLIAGYARTTAGYIHAVVWDASGIHDLGTLGGNESYAYRMNSTGQVVGWSYNASGQQRPFIWDAANGMRDLGTLGGQYGYAIVINDAGVVVGASQTLTGVYQGFVWDAVNGLRPLSLPGAVSGWASWINAAGYVVGVNQFGANPNFTYTAFLAYTGDPVAVSAGADMQLPSNEFGEVHVTLHGEVLSGRPTHFEWSFNGQVIGTGQDLVATLRIGTNVLTFTASEGVRGTNRASDTVTVAVTLPSAVPGPAGEQGPAGQPGAQGPAGPPGIGLAYEIRRVSADTTIDLLADRSVAYLVTTDRADVTMTLPPAATSTSRLVTIIHANNPRRVHVVPQGGDPIAGARLPLTLEGSHSSVTLASDGREWVVIFRSNGG